MQKKQTKRPKPDLELAHILQMLGFKAPGGRRSGGRGLDRGAR